MIAAPPIGEKLRDWKQQWRAAITSGSALCTRLNLDPADPRLGLDAQPDFPVRVPESFARRMRPGDPDDPLLRQVLGRSEERLVANHERADPTADLSMRRAAGVLHKYAGRVLLLATGACAVHCRYCFRKNFPYDSELAARHDWREAIALIKADPSVNEVILSGGDPLSLDTDKLARLTTALYDVPHLRRIRLHTRVPVVLPDRVDGALQSWLHGLPWRVTLVLHANHANEVDHSVAAAAARLRLSGATVLNQAVLLRGVNDSVAAQVALSEALDRAAVLPYYLHLLDPVLGTAHFAVDDQVARAVHDGMKAALPGFLVPRLVREIPGESSKTWVAAAHTSATHGDSH